MPHPHGRNGLRPCWIGCDAVGCGCRGSGKRVNRSGLQIVGYDYTPPDGGDPIRFADMASARVERRRRGGGTITTATA